MKRGLITWDRDEIAPAVFEARVAAFRDLFASRGLPAGVVYSDLWRSNPARSLQNFMPYFNRALLVVPAEGGVVLLCGLSPRVYGWIQSVTPIVDIRPAKDFAGPLEQLATGEGWNRIGVVDEPGLPFDLHAALMNTHLELIDIDSALFHLPVMDASELTMRRRAATIGRLVLESEIEYGAGRTDFELVGRLERAFRIAGAEDVVLLVGHGGLAPAPAGGRSLEREYSVSAAVEYRGHWCRIARTNADGARLAAPGSLFEKALRRAAGDPTAGMIVEDMSSGYPYTASDSNAVPVGAVAAIHVHAAGRPDLVHGDTCLASPNGWTPL